MTARDPLLINLLMGYHWRIYLYPCWIWCPSAPCLGFKRAPFFFLSIVTMGLGLRWMLCGEFLPERARYHGWTTSYLVILIYGPAAKLQAGSHPSQMFHPFHPRTSRVGKAVVVMAPPADDHMILCARGRQPVSLEPHADLLPPCSLSFTKNEIMKVIYFLFIYYLFIFLHIYLGV